jgi:hypothetical protein
VDLPSELEQILERTITVTQGGKKRNLKQATAILERWVNQVMQGDHRARRELLAYADKHGIDLFRRQHKAIAKALAAAFRFSGSMTGVTGRGGNIVVYDDPHDVMELESELSRNEVIRFWTEQLQNRVDPGPAAFVVIMQRLHANDLSGYIIANEFDAEYIDLSNAPWPPEKWRHISFPARFEEKHPHPLRTDLKRKASGEVWRDDRKEGDALWASLFPIKELDKREKGMTPYAIAGQMQQRPVARSGGIFKREWFNDSTFLNLEDIPPGTKWVRGWDLAASEGPRADWTAGVKLGKLPNGKFLVGDVIRVQKEGHEVRDLIKQTAELDGRYCEIRLPKDPAQAGKVQAADFVRMLAGYVVTNRTRERVQGG